MQAGKCTVPEQSTFDKGVGFRFEYRSCEVALTFLSVVIAICRRVRRAAGAQHF